VVKPSATVGRALLTFIAEVAASIVFGMIVLLAFVLLVTAKASDDLMTIAVVILGIIFLVISIAIPMQIYDIGALRSIGFLILSWVIGFVISHVANSVLIGPLGFNKMPAFVDRFASAIEARQRSGDAPNPEFTRRQIALQRQYEQLEIRRKYLPAENRIALAEYERDRTAYERELEQFKADFAP